MQQSKWMRDLLWPLVVDRQSNLPKLIYSSVTTYLRYGGVVNNRIKKRLLLGMFVKKFLKSVNISQSYKEERGCLVHLVRLATTLLKEESARDSHVLVSNFVKYSPIYKKKTLTEACEWQQRLHCDGLRR